MTAQDPEDTNPLEHTSPRDTFKSIPDDDTITMRDVVDYFHKHNIGQEPSLKSTSILRFPDGEVCIDIDKDTVAVRGEELPPAGVMWAVQTLFAVRNKSSGVADMVDALADGTPIQEGEINEATLGILRHKASLVTIPGVGRVAYRVVKACGQDHRGQGSAYWRVQDRLLPPWRGSEGQDHHGGRGWPASRDLEHEWVADVQVG